MSNPTGRELNIDVTYADADHIDPADHCCEFMVHALRCGSYYVYYIPMWRIWGIGNDDFPDDDRDIAISHCPWCGTELPTALSGDWAGVCLDRGFEYDDPNLPEDLRTDRWWKDAGL